MRPTAIARPTSLALDLTVDAPVSSTSDTRTMKACLQQADVDLWDEGSDASAHILASFEAAGRNATESKASETKPDAAHFSDSESSSGTSSSSSTSSGDDRSPEHVSDSEEHADEPRQTGSALKQYERANSKECGFPQNTPEDSANKKVSTPSLSMPNDLPADLTSGDKYYSSEDLFSEVSDNGGPDSESGVCMDSEFATGSNEDGNNGSDKSVNTRSRREKRKDDLQAGKQEDHHGRSSSVPVRAVRRSRRGNKGMGSLPDKRATRGTRPRRFASQFVMS